MKLQRNYFSRCGLHCFRTCNFMYLDDTQQCRNTNQKTRQQCIFFCFLSLLLNVVLLSLSLQESGKECLMKHHLDLTVKRKNDFGIVQRGSEATRLKVSSFLYLISGELNSPERWLLIHEQKETYVRN